MNICALVTLFYPDIEKMHRNVTEMLHYVDKVYLLINYPTFQYLQRDSRVVLINNEKNIGLSAAFNIGLRKAKQENFDFAILFDQDSLLSSEDFNRLRSDFCEEFKKNNVMCIGPSLSVYGNRIGTPKWSLTKKQDVTVNVDSVMNIITSGMLLDINAALKIGGFDERFPVDFCDFFFCWKAIYYGYEVLKSKRSFLYHEIGSSSLKINTHTIHFHAPYRNYFLVRDTLYVCLCAKETPLKIRARYLALLPLRMGLFVLLLDRKTERIKMYCVGFWDFLRNKHGFGSIAELLKAK